MYSVNAYYLAALSSSLLLILTYPILVGIPSFYFFGLKSSSFLDLLDYTACLSVTAIAGSFFGFMIGCFIESEMTAIEVCSLFITLFCLGGGCFANTGENANLFVKALAHVSPIRYGSELILRRLTDGRMVQEQILELFGY